MPRRPVDVRDYDRERDGQAEHVSEYTRMQDVRDAASTPSMLALRRPGLPDDAPQTRTERWEMKGRDRKTGEEFVRHFETELDAWEEHDRLEDAGFDVGDPYKVRFLPVDVAWEDRHYIDAHYPDGTPRPENDPARPWDRVLWGLGAMAAEAGIVKDPRAGYDEAGNIWHYPTASMDDSYTREMVLNDMERSLGPQFGSEAGRSEEDRLARMREDLDFVRSGYWRVSHAEREIPTKDDLDRTVDIELDASIKNDYPGIRRNSKQYKELYASHRAGAERFYTQRGEEAKARAVAELERERNDMVEPARKARHEADYQLRRVAWVEALRPGSTIAARERRIAERQRSMADEYDRYVNGEIARVKNLPVGRAGSQPVI